ncbi:hypothetical protein PLESTM_001721400 [Pleodorina starrii]|nr:hypothetical protein PLESTM_001721400 [Pleodorina starrii]
MSAPPPPAYVPQSGASQGPPSAAQPGRSRPPSPTLDVNAPAFLPATAAAVAAAAHAAAAAARVSGSGANPTNAAAPYQTGNHQQQYHLHAPPSAATAGGGGTYDAGGGAANGTPSPTGAPMEPSRPPRPPSISINRDPNETYSYGPPSGEHGAAGAGFSSQRERRHSAASYSSQGGAGGGGPASGSEPGGGGGDGQPGSLNHMIDFINHHKLAGNRPVYAMSAGGDAAGARGLHSRGGAHPHPHERDPKWVQPSGPRRPGEGVENEEQGIVSAEKTPQGMILRITLLAAGFVIGPSGSSVREIMRVTGADIKSWTENRTAQQLMAASPGGGGGGDRGGPRRPCRMVVVEGEEAQVLQAVNVVVAAVDRYKDLCEGRYQGQAVPRQQRVLGVDFCYQPPPRSVVPCAAALKGQQERSGGGSHGSGPRVSRDDYAYSPPGGSSGGVLSGSGGGYGGMPGYHSSGGYGPTMAADPYGATASYMMAPAMPPSPGRGGHVDMAFAPYPVPRGYDPGPASGGSPPLYGNRMTSGGGSSVAGGSGASATTGTSSGGAASSKGGAHSSGGAGGGYSSGGASINGSSGGAVSMMPYMPMGPMGPMAPLDPGLAMPPLPLPPGSPPMALIPGALSLPPGTDMSALTDYMMKTGGFLAPGGLMPLDMTALGGGVGVGATAGYAPMDLQAAFMAGMMTAQPGGFITGLPGFYYGAPLPGAPLSPSSSGAVTGSPTRSGGASAGSGGGRGVSSGSAGGASNVSLPPPSPSRLNPLAQPWAVPFMTRDPHAAGLGMAGMGGMGGGPAGPIAAAGGAQGTAGGARMNGGGGGGGGGSHAAATGPATPLGHAVNGAAGNAPAPSPASAGGSTPGVSGHPNHPNDDDDDYGGGEVALAAAERALANRTPKRPVKVTHGSEQSGLPLLSNAGLAPPRVVAGTPAAGGPDAAAAAAAAAAGDLERREGDGAAGTPDAPLPAIHGSPTGGLVSAGDPLVSPSRFSANKGRRHSGGRSFRRCGEEGLEVGGGTAGGLTAPAPAATAAATAIAAAGAGGGDGGEASGGAGGAATAL